ncbi:MAG: hypothetical protein IJ639_11810 [Ruminococcus sp.]|nr:hypothetical protein [Ruminococcus sp.]
MKKEIIKTMNIRKIEEEEFLSQQIAELEETDFIIRPYYKPYSHQRVRRYLASVGIDMRTVTGYKYYRYRPCREYRLYDMATNEPLFNGYKFTLVQLRKALASLDIPLKEERPMRNITRNKGCVVFLNAVAVKIKQEEQPSE